MADLEVMDSAPVEAPAVSDSASSTEIDYSTQSDDDILGLDSADDVTAEDPAPQDPAAAPAGEGKPVAAAKPKEEPAKEEEPVDEPESLTRLYGKNPELKATLQDVFTKHPEVRSAWFKAGQIADMFPTVAEAREIRTLFPTVDMAKRANSAAAILSTMDHEITENPQKFAERLAQASPYNFTRLMDTGRKTLYSKSPQAYAETIGTPVALDAFANMSEMASQANDEPFLAALAIVADRMGLQPGQVGGGQAPQRGALPDDPRIRELEQLKANANRIRTQAVSDFSSSVDRAYENGLIQSVVAAVGKPEGMSAKTIQRIQTDIVNTVWDQIAMRKDLQPQYEQFKRAGNLSDDHKNNAANFLLSFAKQLVGPTARKVINEWTNDILQRNQQELQKVAAKPKSKDVGAGSSSPRTGKSNTLPTTKRGKIDYSQASDDDILNS